MAYSIVHLAAAAVLAGLAVLAGRVRARWHRSYTLIVLVVVLGLTYDNAVLGLGRWLGHGDELRAVSLPRFWLHAFTTPLLIVVAIGAARAFGLRGAAGRGVHAAFCVLATALVGWGVVVDVVRLELERQSSDGVVSYGNAQASVPVPAIATIVVLLAVGIVVWAAAGWPWLAAAAGIMLVASGLGGISPLLTNAGELVLAAGLVATEHRAGREASATTTLSRSPPSRSAAQTSPP